MRKNIVFHPFLFAVYPVLFLFAHNIDELLLRDLYWPSLAMLTIAVVVWIGLRPLIPESSRRGLVLAIAFFFFFSYGHLYNAAEGARVLGMGVGRHMFLFPLWSALLCTGVYAAIRTRARLDTLTPMLNVLASGFILVSASQIAFASINRDRSRMPESVLWLDDAKHGVIDSTIARRDIYYIILDRYGSAHTLQDQYGYDNREFLDYLSSAGFFVATESNANYPKTAQSLASSLNLSYLDGIAAAQGRDSDDVTPLYGLLQDHALWRFLKSQGYRYFHFGSWWPATRKNRFADTNVNSSAFPEVFMVLYETTLLYPVTSKIGFLPDRLDHRRAQHARVLYKFDQLAKVPDADGPIFAFVHMLLPHDPYVFDRDGSFLPEREASARSESENFIAQLEFTNRKIQVLVDSLLARYDLKPIIILQGDEGPFPERYVREGGQWWKQATRKELAQKLGILNAYYLPDGGSELLYPSITPVNSFRAVLSFYFGAGLPLLADRSYAVQDDEHIYSFIEVTDSLESPQPSPVVHHLLN